MRFYNPSSYKYTSYSAITCYPGNGYIPREFLNMIDVEYIDFSIFATGNNFYTKKTSALNHNELKWKNLVSLIDVFHISIIICRFDKVKECYIVLKV